MYHGRCGDMKDFFKNKKVLITGHTGFKGTWLTKILLNYGANITGYSLNMATKPNLFDLCHIYKDINSIQGDIRDFEHLKSVIEKIKPDIVIHLAAQPLVLQSYKEPVSTYETNVMGTVNLLEAIRQVNCVRSVLNVTTDKVYENREQHNSFQEDDRLNGYDPYSNSKSCSELVTNCYKKTMFKNHYIAISTARAGNVIGGGDFSDNRIIPDCIRAFQENSKINLRNPYSIRPYQHVLDALFAYLLIIKRQYEDIALEDSYNIGPDEEDINTNMWIVNEMCKKWEKYSGKRIDWISNIHEIEYEAKCLMLDCTKMKKIFSWKPNWSIDMALDQVIHWTYLYLSGADIMNTMDEEIKLFESSYK